MLGNVVKAMYAEGYTARQCSLIAGCSYDYVFKIIRGERGGRIAASIDGITTSQLKRKHTLDLILSLRGYDLVPSDQLYNYLALLAYLGYKDFHLVALYPNAQLSFLRQAAHYNDKA